MALIAYTNNNKHTVHIGGKAIAPGDTREVEETLLASFKPVRHDLGEEDSATPLTDRLNEILSGNVKSVSDSLEALNDEELALMETLENESEAPRKGVLQSILNETVARANLAIEED